MRYKTMYRFLVVTVFILLMSLGIYIGAKYMDMTDNKKSEEVSTAKKENVNIYKDEVKEETKEETKDVSINFVDIYSDCGHLITTSRKERNTTKENIINELKNKNSEYSLAGEQDNVLIFEKTYKGKCHNHYKVKLENNEIVIYKIGDSGGYELYQSSGVLKETIREDLITALIDGIEAYGIEELYIIMEDIES